MFDVYDITDGTVGKLKPIPNNPFGPLLENGPYPSCVYPKLVDNSLQFESALYCDSYPIRFYETAEFYSVELN